MPLDHRRPFLLFLFSIKLLILSNLQALLTNIIQTTSPSCKGRGRTRVPYRIDFKDRGRTVYLLIDAPANQAMRNDTENAPMLLDSFNVSTLDHVCEEADKMPKAEDLSKIHPVSPYWDTASNSVLVLAGHGMCFGGTRGDTSMTTGNFAYPNKHREQHQQAREDTMQETTEEIKDALEKSSAKINMEHDSKESHLSEPRKDSAIGTKDLKPSIYILATEGQEPAVATLDTGCDAGNWITRRLVHVLGRELEISPSLDAPQVSDANGQRLQSCGIISLQFRLVEGFRFHKADFFVAHPKDDACDSWDVILGGQFLVDKGWILFNKCAMLTLIAHKKMTFNEKREIASGEEKQRREKAEIEARRLAAQQAQKQSKLQQSRLQSGQSRT